MSMKTETNHKTVYSYTCPDGTTLSSCHLDYITVELTHNDHRSFYAQLVCRLPHDVRPRILTDKLVRFTTRKAMLAAFDRAE